MDSKHCNHYRRGNTPNKISLKNVKILCVEKDKLSIILEELFVVDKIPDIIVKKKFFGHPNHQLPLPPTPTEKSAFLK